MECSHARARQLANKREKKWRTINRDHFRAQARKYAEKKRELLREKSRAYHAANRERINERHRIWKEANQEHCIQYQRARRKAKIEQLRERDRTAKRKLELPYAVFNRLGIPFPDHASTRNKKLSFANKVMKHFPEIFNRQYKQQEKDQ